MGAERAGEAVDKKSPGLGALNCTFAQVIDVTAGGRVSTTSRCSIVSKPPSGRTDSMDAVCAGRQRSNRVIGWGLCDGL